MSLMLFNTIEDFLYFISLNLDSQHFSLFKVNLWCTLTAPLVLDIDSMSFTYEL